MTSIRERVILRRAVARGGVFAATITSLILLLPLSASALTFHWIGGASGTWNDANEWDTIDPAGSEAAWPSTTGDIAIFPATIVSAVTVTIPAGVNAAFGELQLLTNFTVTIQRVSTGQIIVGTSSEADNGDINIQGTGDHVIWAPMRMDRHVTVHVANLAASVVFFGSIGQSGARNFNKTGPGNVRFAAAVSNTYTGTTNVASGMLELLHSGGATAIAGPLVVGQGVPPPNTATVVLLAGNQIANTSNVTVRRDGVFSLGGLSDTIATLTVTDGSTITGPAGDLTVSGLSMTGGNINIGDAGSTFTLQGNVTATSSTLNQSSIVSTGGGTFSLSGADRTFTVDDGPGNDLVIETPIIGTGGERLIKDGAGVLVMGGAFPNSYLGITTVRDGRLNLSKTVTPAIAGPLTIGDGVGAANSAEVRLTVANQIANGSPVDIASDGLLQMSSLPDTIGTLQVNGGNVQVGPVSDLTTNTITLNGGNISIGATARCG
jgi:autotransporter-associated beta strand protein